MTGNDIDHPLEGVGTVSRRGGTPGHLDTLDILDLQRKVIPQHPRQPGQILGTTVDQHLHAPRIARLSAVVADRRDVAIDFDRAHARHHLQQLIDFPGSAGLDQFAVNNRDAGRHLGQRLAEPRRRQHNRHAVVSEWRFNRIKCQ